MIHGLRIPESQDAKGSQRAPCLLHTLTNPIEDSDRQYKSQGSKTNPGSPATQNNVHGPLGLVFPGLGMSLCVLLQSQLGTPARSLCYLRDVLITSYPTSPSCKAPPDHPALWAPSYLLTLSSPSITAPEFYLNLHGTRLISTNNWNSWLVTRHCCHQGGGGFRAHIQLFLSFHSREGYLIEDTLTFCWITVAVSDCSPCQADCCMPSIPIIHPSPPSAEQPGDL